MAVVESWDDREELSSGHAVSLDLEPVSWKIKVLSSFVGFNKPVLIKLNAITILCGGPFPSG